VRLTGGVEMRKMGCLSCPCGERWPAFLFARLPGGCPH
jgi:hypothetical protein